MAPRKKKAGDDAGASRSRGLPDLLARLGITRDADLVLHLPLRYEDHTRLTPLASLAPGLSVQTEGVVVNTEIQYRPRRQLVCLIADPDDRGAQLVLRFFTFYPSQQKALAPGQKVRVFGDVRPAFHGLEIVHPQWKAIHEDVPLPDRLTPVYPTTAGLAQEALRKLVARSLAGDAPLTAETLPDKLIARRKLWKFGDAVRFLHAPPPRISELTQRALDARTHPAWTRLKFDELLAQQLSLKAHRNARAQRHAPVLTGTGELTARLIERAGFTLTRAQQKVWREIAHDLKRAMPMQRLLQGDVGSGKTVVAALAALQAIESGMQVAFMAPTEILAEQHYRKLSAWLDGLGVPVAWLTGSVPAKARRKAVEGLASGEIPFAVGTHALFQEGVEIPKLGLAIVDEQHRFGVAQRLALRGKAMAEAHQLMMSATPIPRTLAMTFYADLDVSVIDEMPPGRIPVKTRVIEPVHRERAYNFIEGQLEQGRQAFIVYPLVEASESIDAGAAVEAFEDLKRVFFHHKVGLLHGKMKAEDKDRIMAEFREHQFDVMVTTSVAEVGVDIPNASVILIEGANRFGLAQLHQFRGRVGRGDFESFCLLLCDTTIQEARDRLHALELTNDGFKLAEIDMQLRGAGDLINTRQSGKSLLQLVEDMKPDLVELAQREARTLFEDDPTLEKDEHHLLAQRIRMLQDERSDIS